jgi:hypothetical protein
LLIPLGLPFLFLVPSATENPDIEIIFTGDPDEHEQGIG